MRLEIISNFKCKNDILSFIKQPSFFKNFIEILKENPSSKNHRFDPEIKDSGLVSFPQNIYYSEVPRFSIPFVELLEIDIHQKWILNDENFECFIKVKLKGNQIIFLRLFFTIRSEGDKIVIIIFSTWVERMFLIPDTVLENITNQVKVILERLFPKIE